MFLFDVVAPSFPPCHTHTHTHAIRERAWPKTSSNKNSRRRLQAETGCGNVFFPDDWEISGYAALTIEKLQ